MAGLGLIAPYITLVINPEEEIPDYLGQFVNYLGVQSNWETQLLFLGLGIVLIFFCKALGNLWIQYRITSFSQRQEVRLRSFLMEAYQNMPYQVYLQRNSSEYVHSVQILVANYAGVLSVLLKVVGEGLISCAIILVLARENLLILSLLLILMGGVIAIYDQAFRKRLRDYGKQNNEANHQIVQSLHEAIEGLKELRILGKEEYLHKRLLEGSKKTAYFTLRQQMLNLAPGYLLEFLLITFVVVVLSIVVSLGGPVTEMIPTMGVFGLAALRLKPTATGLASSLMILRFQRDSIRRLTEDIQRIKSLELNVTETALSRRTFAPFEEFTISQASFTYHGMKQPALHKITLKVTAGETIGFIGPSGSGKTTLVDVMLGLLKPESGSLEFNGIALQEMLQAWRSQVAYLPQQAFLIDNTLKHNVALGDKDSEIDELRLEAALRQASLTTMVEQLPQGVHTMLGEKGVRLSGGQRQRIALARAFYHGRSVLVMDEATSALDNETEQEIVNEIRRLKGQRTMIVIAHRLTTVQHCDRIYLLESGRVVHVGSPEQVLRKLK